MTVAAAETVDPKLVIFYLTQTSEPGILNFHLHPSDTAKPLDPKAQTVYGPEDGRAPKTCVPAVKR